MSTDPAEHAKAEIARSLLGATDLALSAQVLQEFYVQATHTRRSHRLTHVQASALIEAWLRFPVADTTTRLVVAAMESAPRFGVSYWDAAVIEAARILGCDTLLSEDLSHGRDYDGVLVKNPFRGV